jgi:hypothetical protein
MKIDYSKVDAEYPNVIASYAKQREANDAVVLNIVKALNVAMAVRSIEPRGPYGTSYDVRVSATAGLSADLYFSLEHKGKSLRLSVSPNYNALKLTVQAHELKDRKEDSASMDAARDPDKIAAEIIRKVIQPYEYNRCGLIRDHKERQYAAGKRDATVERIAKALGGRIHRDGGGKFTGFADVGAQETLSVYCPADVAGYRFSVTPGGYTTVERVSFSNPDDAVALAGFLLALAGKKQAEEA